MMIRRKKLVLCIRCFILSKGGAKQDDEKPEGFQSVVIKKHF